MVTTFKNIKLSPIANDNVHCIATWKYVHIWSQRERENAQSEFWFEQRLVHYLYEILNRPWLPDQQKIIQARAWLRYERFFTINLFTNSELREFVTIKSANTQLIYDNEERIQKESEISGIYPYQAYVELFKSTISTAEN